MGRYLAVYMWSKLWEKKGESQMNCKIIKLMTNPTPSIIQVTTSIVNGDIFENESYVKMAGSMTEVCNSRVDARNSKR